ncbi:MAG: class I SAM-dependent methyltransferase, partial [Actinobacteria bacterium]|nr:class I SAM-dependent methyltransferase [Actinomycetota bacterium]
AQERAAAYWRGGYSADSHGANVNRPRTYLPTYADLLQRVGYTDEIVRRCADLRLRSVLEVGCNAGRNLAVLAARHPLERIAGVDIGEEAIEVAQSELADDRWELHVRDVMADGLPSFAEPFDVVFSMASLIHMEPGPAKRALVESMWSLTGRRLVLVEAQAAKPGPLDRGVSDSPFWLDDYRTYVPELRDLGVARSGAEDFLDGLPLARLGALVRPLRALQCGVASRLGRQHAAVFRVLTADR